MPKSLQEAYDALDDLPLLGASPLEHAQAMADVFDAQADAGLKSGPNPYRPLIKELEHA